MFSIKRMFMALAIASGVALSGCASDPKKVGPAHEGRYDQLMSKRDTASVDAPEKGKLDLVKSNDDARTRAEEARRSGQVDRAIFYYVKALEYDDQDVTSLQAIGDLHAQMGNHALAKMAYQLVLARKADALEALEGQALSELRLGQYGDAKAHFDQVLEKDPKRLRAINGRAVVADMERDYATATQFYGQALELAPNSSVVLNNFGYSRYLAGDWEKAEQLYVKLLNRFPEDYRGVLNYGLLQARQRHLKDSVATLKKVMPLAAAYNELGYILMLDGSYADAEVLFERALSESPSYFVKAAENLEQVRALRVNRGALDGPAGSPAVVPLKKLPKGEPTSLGLSHPLDGQALNDALAPIENEGARPAAAAQKTGKYSVAPAVPLERRQSLDNP